MTVLRHPLAADPLIAEAKQRARRRRLAIVALAFLVAAAVAGGLLASGGGSGSNEIPWLATRPNIGPANPPLAAPCTASQLGATLSLQGATMSLVGPIWLVNRSSQPCSLLGRPKLSFANATSKWQETRGNLNSVLPYDPLAPPRGSLRALAPGEHVSVELWWSNWCGTGAKPGGSITQPPAAIVLTPPGGGEIRLANAHDGHGLPSPVCNGGSGSMSTLSASRFTPFVPQGPPSSELPLSVRIVSGGPITFNGKKISQPSFVAKAGSWLSYTVVLRNRSRHVFRFGRRCPSYEEGFEPLARDQAYVLNCHPVGAIGPWKSVRFAMRIHVPRNLKDPLPAFGWSLAPNSYNASAALAVVELR